MATWFVAAVNVGKQLVDTFKCHTILNVALKHLQFRLAAKSPFQPIQTDTEWLFHVPSTRCLQRSLNFDK